MIGTDRPSDRRDTKKLAGVGDRPELGFASVSHGTALSCAKAYGSRASKFLTCRCRPLFYARCPDTAHSAHGKLAQTFALSMQRNLLGKVPSEGSMFLI